ncbi:MAG: DUF4382 domain-containing protein [Nannocystales bacterium]
MTHKIALSLALFASFGMTACTVDSPPPPEEFNYSFLDELPGAPTDGRALAAPGGVLDSQISIEFRDSLHGTDDVPERIAAVPLTIDGVRIGVEDAEGNMSWRVLGSKPVDVDLMTLADGESERISFGPAPEGHYSAIAFKISSAQIVKDSGASQELGLPGSVTVIEEDFALEASQDHAFLVQFGGLRGIENGGDGWATDPNLSFIRVDD